MLKKLILNSTAFPDDVIELLPSDLPQVLGRSRAADITITDRLLSRKHSEIRLNDQGEFLLVDLDSTNLTIVNETDIRHHILQHGDRILLGDTEIAVQIEDLNSAFNEQTTREIDAVPPASGTDPGPLEDDVPPPSTDS